MTPPSDRFQPSRAGVINVWDYVDEEFAFADGRLVLRGHNGSGKTKALEVLFPFILDGVADARRLDPFSGENRTMKSNLLYRGQEAEYGYVWMEFAPREIGAEPAATDETVTLIIGIRAHRHRDGVRTSFFVTDKRLGVDFGLLAPDSRPLTERQLKAVLGPDAHSETATQYRDAVDARLFGLGRERYTQLLDLLLALRRPLLAKDLDPDKVSGTLTSGLSPVDEELVDQAARDFENLAAVQKQFDDFAVADAAVRAFLTDYVAYLRTHAKARLARIQSEMDGAVEHARTLVRAEEARTRAAAAREAAAVAAGAAEAEREGLERRLAALRADDAYRARGELELRRRQIVKTGEEIERERARLADGAEHLAALEGEAGELAERLEGARAAIVRHATELADAAERAGVSHDGDGPADTGADLLTTARARATARRDDVAKVRDEIARVSGAERDRLRAEADRDKADKDVEERESRCEAADAALVTARDGAREALDAWAARWARPADGLADESPGDESPDNESPDNEFPGDEAVAGPADVAALAEALAQAGVPGAPSLAEVHSVRTEERRTEAARSAERLSARVRDLAADLVRLRREREEIAAERDEAPPHDDRRTADRDGRPGAPLWRLVRFADGLDEKEAAGLEGALYGAGLLTAWVHPEARRTLDAVAVLESDGYLLPLPEESRPSGPTLADVLVPEEQDLVPAAVVADVLRSVAVADAITPHADRQGDEQGDRRGDRQGGPAPTVSVQAQFGLGLLLGARPKSSPEYIGATNRANRRAARLAEYDEAIGETTRAHEDAERDLARANRRLEDFARARRELPSVTEVVAAVTRVSRESALLAQARSVLADRRRDLDATVAQVDAARRRLRQVAAERSMPVAEREVDAVARAVDDFLTTAQRLHDGRERAAAEERDLASRQAAIARQRERHDADSRVLEDKEREHRADAEELRAGEEALDAPLREVLAQIGEAERRLAEVRRRCEEHAATATRENEAFIVAQNDLKHGQASLGQALGHLFEHVAAFGPYAHPELRPLLGVTATAPWPAHVGWPEPAEAAASVAAELSARSAAGETAGEGAGERDSLPPDPAALVGRVLPGDVAALLDAFAAEMADVRVPGESALKNTASRLSASLRTFQDALDGCAEDYRLEHDPAGVVMVYVSDEGGRNPVAAFARRVADRVQEQGMLLEERERTVLEDELLTTLAQQVHDRVRTARDLVRGMNEDTRSRPMSSGTRIGIRWGRSDRLNDRQVAVSRLLDRDAQGLGAAGLAELRGLLREMIRDYRATHPRATYRQALAEVLDYRTWYGFELVLAVPGEKEVKLTRAKHEEMSGGEKSAAIHLPLFAAANALYSSAKPTCPRMIALDEAFAGIDDRYKPELLGLTVKFGLDLFMTGHDLWIHFDTVPMAAHYDMHHDKSAHAVSAMLMLWDGAQTIDADAGFSGNEELAETLLGFRPSRRAPALTEGTLLAAHGDEEPDEVEAGA
ncbi:SbcC/MukB-like Walker B domain-containing protein [Microbispora hainanensis]|uniref:TIGR02680 family protein n=1 Tax=Microbispora hainanensis TaxID=568844 RepID=A0A544YZU1_9ACTN|nr:SbcC/MukB-like Walker B domain-containing protein [Microbispora hainanensis]TQS22306.1 TIGR02680 family protein [Microbispora hainanensis]